MSKKNFLIYLLFTVVGLVLAVFSVVFIVHDINFRKTAVKVEAEITRIVVSYDSDGDADHDVYVKYEFNGETYENVELNEYSSSMYEGKKITILVNPAKPTDIATSSGLKIVSIILPVLAVATLAVGGTPIVRMIIDWVKKLFYTKKGVKLTATVESVEADKNKRVKIVCSADYNGAPCLFEKKIYKNDGIKIGDKFSVYVSEDDNEKYYLDLNNNFTE